jgi:hypothetical protein
MSTIYYSAFHPAESSGAKGSAAFAASALNTAIIYLYRRSATDLTASDKPNGSIIYTFDPYSINLSAVTNGWTKDIPAGDDPLYVVTITVASDDPTVTITTGEWSTPVILAQDGETYLLSIESTNGTIFRDGLNQQTTLIARLFRNGEEVTATTPASQFRWRRVSIDPKPYPNDDATWNTTYQSGYKQITISVDDVDAKATFFCDIITP